MLLKLFRLTILFVLVLFSTDAVAGIVNASLVGEHISLKPHYTYKTRVIFKLEIEEGWHIYWANPGDSGEETIIELTSFNHKYLKNTSYSLPKKVVVHDFVELGLENDAYMMAEVDIPAPNRLKSLKMDFDIKYLACKDNCVPGKTSISFEIPVKGNENIENPLFNEYLKYFPDSKILNGKYHIDDEITLFIPKFSIKEEINSLEILPYKEGMIDLRETPSFEINEKGLTIQAKLSEPIAKKPFKALLKINDTIGFDVKLKKSNVPLDKASFPFKRLIVVSAFALLGGLILNLMPCVLPVLSLKAFQIIADTNTDKIKEHKKGAIFYTLGILVAFIGLGTLLSFINGKGIATSWGFQMQQPYFILAMVYVFFILGLMLSELINLDFCFTNQSPKSSFVAGLLTVLIASPCTAPFMGVAIAFAVMMKSQIITIIVFSCLGLGLALPWLVIAFIPSLSKKLPKPGEWMIHLKHFLAFFIYATVIWLLWVIMSQVSNNLVALVLVSLLFIIFTAWTYKFKNYYVKSISTILCIILIGWCFNLSLPIDKKLTANFEKFSKEKIDFHKSKNIPTFIKFSAKWCLTCIVNDSIIFSDNKVMEAFRKNGVVVLHADFTNKDKEIDEIIKAYGRSGVPLYVYYDGEKEIILPPIISKDYIIKTISE